MDPRSLQQVQELLSAARYDQAKAILTRQLQRSPQDPNANNLMAITMIRSGMNDQAIYFAQRACDVLPQSVMLRVNLATTLVASGKTEKAIEHFRAAYQAEPTNAEAATGLINSLCFKDRFGEASDIARQALARNPTDGVLVFSAAAPLLQSGRAPESLAALRRGAALDPANAITRSRIAACMLYDPASSAEGMFAAHQEFAQTVAAFVPAGIPPAPKPEPTDADRKLRIGILSSDFREHAVARFLSPILERLDRTQFELTCYHNEKAEDKETQRLRRLVSAWRNVTRQGEVEAAAIIRRDKIDILIETIGLSGRPCPVTLLLKPAPLIISWMGYPASVALPTIDYRIIDSLTDPPGAERLHTEKLIRLDPCFLCFPAPSASPQRHRTSTNPITFGCFNTIQKVSDPLLATWAKILKGVPDSRLVLKSTGLEDPVLQTQVRGRAAAAGIDPARLTIHGVTKEYSAHLAMYGDIDIALDTFPYCGTTTTCEALCMGTPVVSRAGDAHHSRVGLSLLSCVGHPELCTDSEQAYIDAAVPLAKDNQRLARLHEELPRQAAASPLCDQQAFVTRFGAALRQAWREQCSVHGN